METWLFAVMINVIMNTSPDGGKSGFVNWKQGKTPILMRINRAQFWEGAEGSDEDEKWMLRGVSKRITEGEGYKYIFVSTNCKSLGDQEEEFQCEIVEDEKYNLVDEDDKTNSASLHLLNLLNVQEADRNLERISKEDRSN
ncbi:hypothetical protein K0M31_010999 [Melipona bicolor]|uniref:Uncharacterized protein n=1 Tax=Melipona bicolor TaxID=60889 RepID=A0AA40KHY5_9HYME|nr:hypothetical protein K0M31_010999 [Melipona bicolor]